jgi:methionyl-tRNA synthetase
MLMSAGLPLPGQIAANGFITHDGVKMSKSLGNGIDPLALAAQYGNDAVRYFLLREIPYGEDGDYSEEKMKDRYNADLANGLGNLVARVLTLAEKENGKGTIVAGTLDPAFDRATMTAARTIGERMGAFKFSEALAALWELVALGDRSVNERKVWEIADDAARGAALFDLVSLLEAIAALLAPFMPETARAIDAAIRWEDGVLHITKPAVLFPRIK